MSETKKTPIYESHIEQGARMVPFAGWEMPVQYSGLKEEHLHARKMLGLFDVSHMGEIRVRGRDCLKTLQWLTTNDVEKLQKGQAQYSLFPNEKGGLVDDLIVYCMEPKEDYLLCVNASNKDKDLKFLLENNRGAIIEDESDRWGQIAVQGPEAMAAVEAVTGLEFSQTLSFHFVDWQFEGELCHVARTGYTGEDGAEIFVPWDKAKALWDLFFQKCPQALPIGLGARDTLRMEMRYPLYGQEITDTTSPYEAGLGWVVKPDKGDFLGKTPMMEVKDKGIERKLVGLEIHGRGIARTGYKVFSFDNEELGVVTSGTLSPSLNKAIAVAYVAKPQSEVGTKLQVEIRNKMVEAEVVKTPFYKKG
ncbi:MAG: glycine cleavage system aminomethyltransferase GcvT [Bdellovibrionales bacterium]|nr:glycine cleavage system aminomethyltransferase GcvT [Bdellovibrionales bacterium]